jgi:uncharacterized protein YndB with AHSA1/START domain
MPTNQHELGRLEKVDDRRQLVFTRKLPHPPEKVWRALTEPEHLDAWFPTTIEGELRAGAPLRFGFREHEIAPMEGEMLAYEPPSRLEFMWGPDRLSFTLEPDGGGTLLTLVDVIDELGKAARDGAGWHEKLDVLEYHLRGEEPPKPGARWKQVHPDYVERFGPEAATIGPPEGMMDN